MFQRLLMGICVLLSGQIYAQTLGVTGQVLDASTYAPLDFVSVYAESKEGAIVAFGNTDAAGKYTLEIEVMADSLVLVATILSYEVQRVSIAVKEQEVDFELRRSAYALQEVVVREEALPVIAKSDTTIFNLASFVDSTEYSVEDVLKKLPGIEVSATGTITVNGKAIEKVLIEGDDLFGANYTVGTRNLRAQAIDRVEVIDRFQDNPVLADVKESDRMVLNLSITEEKKRILAGTLTVGTGYGEDWKHSLHTNVFSFGRKSKLFVLGNANNVGFDAMGEMTATYGQMNLDRQSVENGRADAPALLRLPEVEQIGLPTHLTDQQKVGLLNIGQVFTLKERLKARLSATVQRANNQQFFFNETRLISPENPIGFKEEHDFLYKQDWYDFVFQMDYYSAAKSSSLKTYTSIQQKSTKTQNRLLRYEQAQANHLPIQYEASTRTIFNAIEYTQKLGTNTVGQLVVDQTLNANPQMLDVDYQDAPFFDSLMLQQLVQLTEASKDQTRVLARYIFNKGIALNVESGYQLSTTKLGIQRNKLDWEHIDIPRQASKIRIARPFVNAFAKKKFKKLSFTAGLNAAYAQVRIDTEKIPHWLISPYVRLNYFLSEDATAMLFYRLNNELQHETDLFQVPFFTNYQMVRQGLNNTAPIRQQSIGASYKYQDVLNSLYLRAFASYARTEGRFGNAFDFQGTPFKQHFFVAAPQSQTMASISADKLLLSLNSRLTLALNYNSFQNQQDVDGTLQAANYRVTRLRFKYGSSFEHWFNCFLANELAWTISETEESNFRALQTRTSLKAVFRPNTKFYFDFNWYAIGTQTRDAFQDQLHGLDFNVALNIGKDKRSQLKFSINNLLDAAFYQTNSIDNYVHSRYGLRATPRFFLLTWDTSL